MNPKMKAEYIGPMPAKAKFDPDNFDPDSWPKLGEIHEIELATNASKTRVFVELPNNHSWMKDYEGDTYQSHWKIIEP